MSLQHGQGGVQVGKVISLNLTGFAHSGDALGRLPDGRAVFVPFGLPGETVRAKIVEEKTRFARAELVEVLASAEERVEPRCRHFTTCGGCHYQHMSYSNQLTVKEDLLRETLRRLGGITDPPIRPIVPTPDPWYYRNYIQFHLTPEGKVGFYGSWTKDIIPIRECYLPEEPLNIIWPLFELEPIPGLERVSLRSGVDDDVLITLESQDPEPPAFEVDLPVSVIYLGPEGGTVLSGSDTTRISVLDRIFRVSAGTFFQVNTPLAEKMVNHILENLPSEIETVLDLYCGGGLFSAFLAPRTKRLVGVEVDPAACDDFVFNLDEFDYIEIYQAPVEDTITHVSIAPDLIIADPPRSGLGRQVVEQILGKKASIFVYVSCDPGSLARDAKLLLEGGYTLSHITPFDLFPHTFHLETISFWKLG